MTGVRPSRGRLQFAATVESVQDILQQSATSQADIVRHCAQVMWSSAPVLVDAPDWYGAFLLAWSGIAERARIWADAIVPQIAVLPKLVASFGADFTSGYAALQPSLAGLAANPKDAGARGAIAAQLDQLSVEADAAALSLGDFLSQLQSLADQMTPDLATLQTYLADAQQTIGQDIEAVNQLASDIDALKSRVAELETKIDELNAIGVFGVVVTLVTLAVTADDPQLNTLTPLAGVVAAAATTAFLRAIALSQEVDTLRRRIDEESAKMSENQAQVAALQIFSNTLQGLTGALGQNATDMTAVLQIWSMMSADAAQMQDDIADAQKELDAGDVADLQQAFASAADHWAAVQPLAAGMASMSITILPPQPLPTGPSR